MREVVERSAAFDHGAKGLDRDRTTAPATWQKAFRCATCWPMTASAGTKPSRPTTPTSVVSPDSRTATIEISAPFGKSMCVSGAPGVIDPFRRSKWTTRRRVEQRVPFGWGKSVEHAVPAAVTGQRHS